MAPPETDKSVKFCYQCGRRTDGTKENCWYCGSYLFREVRPSKKCQFCGSRVAHDAIKCKHCGEFLDGRPREAPVTPVPQQIIYVVDRNLLGGGGGPAGDYRLLPGQPVPDDIARRLSGTTVRAIEQNRPELIDQPGVRMLAAPAGPVLDIEAQPPDGRGERRALPNASRELATRGGGSGNLPVRAEDTPQRTSSGLLAKLGRWLIRTAPGRTRPTDDIPEAKIEDRFRICENCQTEILYSDNFCYHCGFQYHRTQSDPLSRRARHESVGGLYFLILMLIVGEVVIGLYPTTSPPWMKPVVAGIAVLLCVAAFFRKRTFLNQLTTIVLAIVAIVFWYV